LWRKATPVARNYSQSNSPVIISVAVTGDCHDNSRTNVPLTPKEQIQQATDAFHAGARIVHVHVRDDNGNATSDPNKYKEVLDGLRESAPDLLVEFSTTNFAPTIKEQVACLHHKPDLASVTPGSCNLNSPRPNVPVYVNTHEQIDALVTTMKGNSIKPNLGIFDVSMIYNAYELLQRDLLVPPFRFIFVLGGYMALPARRSLLEFMVNECNSLFGKENFTWSTVGVGWNHNDVVQWTLELGGHPRTGFEDTLMLEKGVYAKSNAELVQNVVKKTEKFGRRIATPEEAKHILGIPQPITHSPQ